MVITSTPFRISFFGGGTDYPAWFREHGGAVLAASINRYCHLSCRFYPPFFDHKHRIVWSQIELVRETDEIQHPAIREAIRLFEFVEGLEIHHDGDLPARAGLGSSSSFVVGLLYAMHALRGNAVTKQQLAQEAIRFEQDILVENVGVQDQITAAFGGLNVIEISPSGSFEVKPLKLSITRAQTFQDHCLLFYTGVSRTASEIAKEQIVAIPTKTRQLARMQKLVYEAAALLIGDGDITGFGEMLHETWELKRSISPRISTPLVDDLYARARRAGALGGKLLGAGGGGFVLLFVRPDERLRVLEALKEFLMVPFEIDSKGTRMVLNEPDHFSMYARTTRGFVR